MTTVPHPFIPFNHVPEETPPKIDVAFRVLAYCRSITDPGSLGAAAAALQQMGASDALMPIRPLSKLEQGAETAAINIIRDWLNGEINLSPSTVTALQMPEDGQDLPSDFRQFSEPWSDDDDQEVAS